MSRKKHTMIILVSVSGTHWGSWNVSLVDRGELPCLWSIRLKHLQGPGPGSLPAGCPSLWLLDAYPNADSWALFAK